MCTHISVSLPASADIDKINKIFARYHMSINESDISFPKLVLDKERWYTTNHYCDCGTVLSSCPINADSIEKIKADYANEIHQLWSKNQKKQDVAGWIELKAITQDPFVVTPSDRLPGRHNINAIVLGTKDWSSVINEVIENKISFYFGLMIREDGEDLDGDRVHISRTEANLNLLKKMRRNTLYVFF